MNYKKLFIIYCLIPIVPHVICIHNEMNSNILIPSSDEEVTTCMLNEIESNISISSWCENIHCRSYILKRINHTMNWLIKRKNNPIVTNAVITAAQNTDLRTCKDCCIRKMIKKINLHKAMNPLLTTWQQFIFYQHLNNITHPNNTFLTLLLRILENIVANTDIHNNLTFPTITNNTLTILDAIDLHMDYLTEPTMRPQKNTFNYFIPDTTPLIKNTLSQQNQYTELFTKTIYYPKRLERCFTFLELLKKYFRCAWDFEEIIINHSIPHITFSEPTILLCIENLISQKNISPLLVLWKKIKQGRFINNKCLLREFAIVTYIISNTIISEYEYQLSKKKIFKFSPYLYNNFESLPFEEILDIIDLLSEEIPKIIVDNDLEKPMGWTPWCRKHCLSYPIYLIKLGIKLAIKLKPLFGKKQNESICEEKNYFLFNDTHEFPQKD